MSSASCIYEGAIRHRRFAVRRHAFRYRLALAYIDLDELPTLLRGRLLRPWPGLIRFRRSDYVGQPEVPLADAVRDAVQQRTGARPTGPIRLLTQPRSFGHCFNPVSFYYCFDPAGERVEHVLAEVTNTPWGERYTYVLSADSGNKKSLTGASTKQLHVSPFMGMDHSYTWRMTVPGERLEVHIESHRSGSVAFDATLALRRRELTRSSLARLPLRYPFASIRVLVLIYVHALALKLKGISVHPHPGAEAA